MGRIINSNCRKVRCSPVGRSLNSHKRKVRPSFPPKWRPLPHCDRLAGRGSPRVMGEPGFGSLKSTIMDEFPYNHFDSLGEIGRLITARPVGPSLSSTMHTHPWLGQKRIVNRLTASPGMPASLAIPAQMRYNCQGPYSPTPREVSLLPHRRRLSIQLIH